MHKRLCSLTQLAEDKRRYLNNNRYRYRYTNINRYVYRYIYTLDAVSFCWAKLASETQNVANYANLSKKKSKTPQQKIICIQQADGLCIYCMHMLISVNVSTDT